jgi:hypothetical protein
METTINSNPQLGTFELHCRAYPAMIAWYKELTGATIILHDPVQCWLRAPAGWHLVLLDTQFGPRPREVAGLTGPSLSFASMAELSTAYRGLKARNVYPERAVMNGMVTSLIYRDPDGNPVSLRYLLPEETRRMKDVSLIGDEFDPAIVLESA